MTEKRRKKVLFMLPTLGPGGAERVLVTVMNNIDRARFAPEFLAFNDAGPVREWVANDIPFHSFGHKSVKQSIIPLLRLIRREKPDVLFTTMVHSNAVACLVKIFFPKVRVIIRESSLPTVLVREYGWKGRMCLYIYKYLYPLADVLIGQASITVREFKEDLHIKNVNYRVIFNPVDVEKLRASLPDHFENGAERDKSVIFSFVGRLAHEKGLDMLIPQLAQAEFPFDWRLDLYGEGDQRGNLERLVAEHGLQKNIFFHGYNNDPWRLVAQGDCLLLPSRWEGLSNAVLEALACGIPVIAMKTAGAISDVADLCKKGEVVVAQDIQDFVAEMTRLCPRPKERPAASMLPQEFALDYVVRDYEDIL